MAKELSNLLVHVKNKVDRQIEKRLHIAQDELIEALYQSALYSATGGKRIRAVLVFLAGRLFGVEDAKILSSATAVELVHSAALIMGDLPYMDDSQLRRGKPANHVVFGQDVALLASIGLLSEAIQILQEDDLLSEVERNHTTAALAASFGLGGLAAGQFIDLKLKPEAGNFRIVEYINEKKTAALFVAGAKMAGYLGGASKDELKSLNEYARHIGFAFNIVDDLLESRTMIENKQKLPDKNMVHLFGEEGVRKYLSEYREKAENALQIFGEKANDLKAFNAHLINRW